MKNWDIPIMIIATRKRIIPETAIPRRSCIPAMAIWRSTSPGIGKGSLIPRSSKIPEYRHSGHGGKDHLHVCERNDYE